MSRSEKSRRNQKQRLLRTRQKRLGQQTAIRSTAGRPPGRFKMSEVIEHLAEPLIEQLGDSPEDIERIIMMTIVGVEPDAVSTARTRGNNSSDGRCKMLSRRRGGTVRDEMGL